MVLFGYPAFLELLLISSGLSLFISLIYKLLLNQEALREIKTKVKEKQEKMKEAQKTNPKEAEQLMNEVLILNNKQLRTTMKPMFASSIIILLVFGTLRESFPGNIVNLPIALPFWGATLGWLGWYILISIPLNQLFRTILGVEL